MDQRAIDSKDYSVGSIPKAILSLAGPLMVAQLVNVLYSIVDRIFLGQLPEIGSLALAGLGLTMPIISIITACANLCGTGGGPLCSIHRGEGELRKAEQVIGNCFTLLLIIGASIIILGYIFKEPILYLFGASADTYPYANEYLSWYLPGTLFVMISLGMNPMINAQGFGRTGMLTVALGAGINLVLDPLFIYAFGFGIRGAATATVIAQACSAAWVLKFLTGKKAILHLRLKDLRLEARRVGKIISLGLAGFFMNLTNSLVQVVCNRTLQAYGGDLYVSIMTIVNSIREVFFMMLHGLNNGAQPVIGYNYGAKKYDRVRQAILFSVISVLIFSIVIWAILMIFPGPLIQLFSGDEEILAAGIPAMMVYFGLFPFQALQNAGQTTFVSLGKSRRAIFFSLLRKAFINAPLTVLLPMLGLGAMGVFIAESSSQLIGGLACFITMYLTVYRPLKKGRPI